MTDCRCSRVGGGLCRCADETLVRSALLDIQREMIAACRAFVEASLADIAPDAAVRRDQGRYRLTNSVTPGWKLGAFRDSSGIASDPLLVLVSTGEIFCERGSSRLTEDELTDSHWEIHGWVQGLMDRYGIRGWPTHASDLRRLAIDFHFASEKPRLRPTQVS